MIVDPSAARHASDDPIRAEVERVLHDAVDATLVLPRAAFARVRRCVASTGERLCAPLRLARSVVDAVAAGFAGPAAAASAGSVPAAATGGTTGAATAPPPAGPAGGGPGDAVGAPHVDDLPIEEYASLAASHVVDRLAQLDDDDLRKVREFELANRARRTVVGKIDQLLAST